ncbi:alpha/beta fold hydrolase [Amycolatopsis taiwanensis]|uniref:3-oxoadipate enol-lactonase n=1 Tax=Amycolatopsis taiwanensis TaxID=342230 RepID=A0A9W6VKA2_9PSEU|nr:alpha/beta hydrolase [Amycolatopsis taiwanensis]GLY69306.1 3-oxoadipate enol-lactonase [Amycolatopsis taiwanensis]
MTISEGQSHVKDDAAESTLPLDDGDIYVYQDGPRDAPVLLLIHGTAAMARSWDLMVPLLTGSHHVIRIDLLGCGRSAKPADGDYEIPAQGRRAGEVADRLGIKHAIVVGHSSGSTVAAALAEQRPDLVTGLVIINFGPDMDAFIAQEPAIGPAQWPPSEEQIRQLGKTGFPEGEEVPQIFVDGVRGMPFNTFAALMQAPRAYLEQRTLPDRLAPLGKPLLVIFGEDDRRWRSSSAAGYRAVPGARIELLSGLGHTPILEDPQRTAAPLLAFTAVHAAQAG